METMNRKLWIQKRKQIPNKQERNFQIACGLLPFFKRYPSIGIYLPILGEVDVLEPLGFQFFNQTNNQKYLYGFSKLLSQTEFEAIEWSAPKVESETTMCFYPLDQLELGAFGILEPKGEKSGQQEMIPSLIIVPLVAFCDGYRKGYGKGYYDRYLQKHPECLRVGIAYDNQEANFIHEDWDQRLDMIVTETRVLNYPRGCKEIKDLDEQENQERRFIDECH